MLFQENSMFVIVYNILCKNCITSVQRHIENIQAKVGSQTSISMTAYFYWNIFHSFQMYHRSNLENARL